MVKNLFKLMIGSLIMIILSVFINISVMASSEKFDKSPSFFIALKAPYYSIGGDFDEEVINSFRAIDSVCYGLYEYKDSLGEGIVFGASNELYTCEFSYSQSKHDINDKLGIIPEVFAELKSFDITVKITPSNFIDKRLKPYGQIGYGLVQFTVENGANDDYYPFLDIVIPIGEFGDAKYTGSVWHMGFGVLGKINNKLSIDTSVTYYRITLDEIKMFNQKFEPPKNDVLMANIVASIGIKYYFN